MPFLCLNPFDLGFLSLAVESLDLPMAITTQDRLRGVRSRRHGTRVGDGKPDLSCHGAWPKELCRHFHFLFVASLHLSKGPAQKGTQAPGIFAPAGARGECLLSVVVEPADFLALIPRTFS